MPHLKRKPILSKPRKKGLDIQVPIALGYESMPTAINVADYNGNPVFEFEVICNTVIADRNVYLKRKSDGATLLTINYPTITGSAKYVRKRVSVNLIGNDEYYVTSDGGAYFYTARIIITQTDATKTTIEHNLAGVTMLSGLQTTSNEYVTGELSNKGYQSLININPAKYEVIDKIYFETYLKAGSGGVAYAALYDYTDGQAVAGGEVSTDSTDILKIIKEIDPNDLIDGHYYGVVFHSTNDVLSYIYSTSIKIKLKNLKKAWVGWKLYNRDTYRGSVTMKNTVYGVGIVQVNKMKYSNPKIFAEVRGNWDNVGDAFGIYNIGVNDIASVLEMTPVAENLYGVIAMGVSTPTMKVSNDLTSFIINNNRYSTFLCAGTGNNWHLCSQILRIECSK